MLIWSCHVGSLFSTSCLCLSLTGRYPSHIRRPVPRLRRDFQLVCLYVEPRNEVRVDAQCPYVQG
jgi:hypothetical protein